MTPTSVIDLVLTAAEDSILTALRDPVARCRGAVLVRRPATSPLRPDIVTVQRHLGGNQPNQANGTRIWRCGPPLMLTGLTDPEPLQELASWVADGGPACRSLPAILGQRVMATRPGTSS